MGGTVAIVVRPSWVSSWFLRAFAVPFVVVDGTEHRVRWGRPLHLALPPGPRLIGAGIRYRGTRRLLGCRPSTVHIRLDAEVRILARNGPLNSEPFRMEVRS